MVQAKSEQHSKKTAAPRKSTSQRHETLRQHLLAAARTFIDRNGLASLRARDLADAVGCSVGAIYNVFEDLDALILDVNALTLQEIDARGAAIKTGTPPEKFRALAATYLGYAVENRRRWDALFTHRLPAGAQLPEWYIATQQAAFSHIEAPLYQLRPDLPVATIPRLARSIFAAVHGIVALGLEHRTGHIDLPELQNQVSTVISAIAAGLRAERPNPRS